LWFIFTIDFLAIMVSHSEGPPWRGDSMGATENAGFNAKIQQNLVGGVARW